MTTRTMKQEIRVVPPYDPKQETGCIFKLVAFGVLVAGAMMFIWIFFWVRNLIK